MKKRYALVAICLALLLLSACAKPAQEEESQQQDPPQQTEQTGPANTPDSSGETDEPEQKTAVFSSNVVEVSESALLVEPAQSSAERASADRIHVRITDDTRIIDLNGAASALVSIGVGDTVEITYNGEIAETYPAEITAQRIAVTVKAEPALVLLTPVEGEWTQADALTGERVTVEESDDAFILRSLADLEHVELARVYYDEKKQDYVQKDLLWMTEV